MNDYNTITLKLITFKLHTENLKLSKICLEL